MLATSLPGRVLGARLFYFIIFCTAMVAVCGLPVRPFPRAITAALTSPCASQQALASEGFPTRDNVRCIPGIRATRSPLMTSPAPNLRCFPCRPARAHRPGNPLREQNTRHAARGASHMRSRVDPRLPNSKNTHRHFNCARGGFVPRTTRSGTGFQSRKRACLGRSQNTERTSHAVSGGAGAVTQTTSCGLPGSLLVSPV